MQEFIVKPSTMKKHISTRESQVLYLIAHENTTNEIAATLHISHHTAMSHRKKLLEKLNVKNTAGLVRRAFELGLMTVGSPVRQTS